MLDLFLYIRNLVDREMGQDIAEYALLFGLMAVVSMMTVSVLGLHLLVQWDKLAALVGSMF